MRRLINFLAAFCLLASLAGGSVVHAAETVDASEVTDAGAWRHVEGDHGRVPADSENGYPHHHNICHGHDLAAPAKASQPPLGLAEALVSRGVTAVEPESGPPGSPLRPPIA